MTRGQSTSCQLYAKSLPIFTKINNSIFDKKNSLILDCFYRFIALARTSLHATAITRVARIDAVAKKGFFIHRL